jgi:hypothetical protein
MSAGELLLRIWKELPERHRNAVCGQIRRRCEAFIALAQIERSERAAETDKLVSEVVAHLLRAASIHWDERRDRQPAIELTRSDLVSAASDQLPWAARGPMDEHEPARDGRVVWLLDEICNRRALSYRYEDLRRRDRGGKWDGTSYPLVQLDDGTIEQLGGHHDPSHDQNDSLHAEDTERAWQGLVKMVQQQFGPDDDVPALVHLLARDRDIQDAFGSQWPIGRIVRALNARDPQAAWNDDRVENAKRRLIKWIARVKRAHGLDATDLRALLAGYARQRQAVGAPRP